tara:strand:- start:3146 stop:4825 length:1680 start_codon:yes stop_codon:yes gene_type:complete
LKSKKKILLDIKKLCVSIAENSKNKKLLKSISFNIKKNEIVGLIGESGSGKSLTSLCILGLLEKKNFNISGEIYFNQRNIINLQENEIMKIRGSEISMIFQEPMTALNPTMKIGTQLFEVFRSVENIESKEISSRIEKLIKKVKLDDIENLFDKYPHQISGGQKQRVMIVMALSCNPKLLIADEPTTALDVTIQKEIIDIIKDLQKSENLSILFISHDLRLVSKISDRIVIMKTGEIIEQGLNKQIFKSPKKDYTKALLSVIINDSKRLKVLPTIETYNLKNKNLSETKTERDKRLKGIYSKNPILEINNLSKFYNVSKSLFIKNKGFRALEKINLKLYKGETLGLIGESGSGKTSLSNAILKIHKFEEGEIFFNGLDISKIQGKELLNFRKNIQIVFQDPYASLNPLHNIYQIISEPLIFHKICRKEDLYDECKRLINDVGLSENFLDSYPHELSGGQRQRVCIARAISVKPQVLICDESVSALDVSIQATVLNLLNRLKQKYSITYIFISHDLSVVRHMSDKILVLHNGKIVEYNDVDLLFKKPKETYTKKLIKASL